MMSLTDVEPHRQAIAAGSKSFALASLFFSKEEKEAAWKLYSWCRYCDDLIDDARSAEEAQDRLRLLREETRDLLSGDSQKFQVSGMAEIVKRYEIPLKYPTDLLEGMASDVSNVRYETLEELEHYCYAVASTVGLMMCHIVGVREDEALPHAVALGKAMQLTNICRDIQDDRKLGRLYIPVSWLKVRNIHEQDLFNPEHQGSLIGFQRRLLLRADELYETGHAGLQYLSPRSAWAVYIAARTYAEIGVLIRQDPCASLMRRAVVSMARKAGIVLSSLKYFLSRWPQTQGAFILERPRKIWSTR